MKIILASIASNIIKRASQEFPKKPQDCKIICIPTAAKGEDGPKDWLENELKVFRDIGFNLTMLDLDGVTEQECSEFLRDADIVYVTGGNTFFLLEKMQACGFENIIRRELERGAIYVGSSAGSVVCCPDIDYVRGMDDPKKANLRTTKGLNLVDFFVMVHMDHESFKEQAHEELLSMKQGPLQIFCLKDNEALFIDEKSISIV